MSITIAEGDDQTKIPMIMQAEHAEQLDHQLLKD